MRNLLITILAILSFSISVFASNVSSLAYSSTNVTTGAYVAFVASTPVTTRNIVLCDTSGQLIKLAVGAALSEVDLLINPLSGCFQYALTQAIPAGSRLSLRAISATANSGFASVSFFK